MKLATWSSSSEDLSSSSRSSISLQVVDIAFPFFFFKFAHWHTDRAKIGMILALIPISLCLIIGRFPVFNVVKSNVLGLLRPQGHLWRRRGMWCKKIIRWWNRALSPFAKAIVAMATGRSISKQSIATVSPRGRHGDRRINSKIKSIKCCRHEISPWQH